MWPAAAWDGAQKALLNAPNPLSRALLRAAWRRRARASLRESEALGPSLLPPPPPQAPPSARDRAAFRPLGAPRDGRELGPSTKARADRAGLWTTPRGIGSQPQQARLDAAPRAQVQHRFQPRPSLHSQRETLGGRSRDRLLLTRGFRPTHALSNRLRDRAPKDERRNARPTTARHRPFVESAPGARSTSSAPRPEAKARPPRVQAPIAKAR